MGKFQIVETGIRDLVIIKFSVFSDTRGYFAETFNENNFKELGIKTRFVQDNESVSRRNVLRGLHFQIKHPQGKLVRVNRGKVFDVAVDLRFSSDTFGKWFGLELSESDNKMFYIPPGFAHGFVSLEENTHFLYKCTEFYYPEDEGGIKWNDAFLSINWPVKNMKELIISRKDKSWPTFKEAIKKYFGRNIK